MPRSSFFRLAPIALFAWMAASCSDTPGGGGTNDATLGGHDGSDPNGDGGPRPGDDARITNPTDDATTNPTDDATTGDALPRDVNTNPNNPNNATIDSDCDGLSDAYEFATVYPDGHRTDPNNPDTDGDGILDGVEVGVTAGVVGAACVPGAVDADPTSHTSPTSPDTDGDGIPDGVEDRNHDGAVSPGETNPNLRDSDGDGIPDGTEDANHNGAVDPGETNPLARDTDGDGIADGLEDANHNGMVDPGETSPTNTDTDGDTIPDGVEDANHNGVHDMTETDPRSTDTDCDGISDDEELRIMTSPILADTDRDGISDGVELGRTMPVAGSSCPGFTPDADPTSMTNPLNPDSDMDGIPDGGEDQNGNGRVDMGELNPAQGDSDGDGVSDGDEVLAGTDPLDPMSPSPEIRSGVASICSDAALKVVDFDQDVGGNWTIANETTTAYAPITVNQADFHVAALDDTTEQFAGFVLASPPLPGAADATGQLNALLMRINGGSAAQQLNVAQRSAPRLITTHDGFGAEVSGIYDVTLTANPRNAATVRNALLTIMSGLAAGSFTGLPTTVGAAGSNFVLDFEIVVRPAESRVLIIATVIDSTSYDSASTASFFLNDLANGTALAVAGARRGKACNPFVASGQAIADFIWMSDISGSTDDDRGRVVSAANVVFTALTTNGVNFRMGVVQHIENTFNRGAGNGGTLLTPGFTRDVTEFRNMLNLRNGDGCEFGLDAASSAVSRALPRTAINAAEDPRKLRAAATLAVVYVSDEHAQEVEENTCGHDPGGAACDTGLRDVAEGNNVCQVIPNAAQQACIDGIVAPYIAQIRAEGGIAFAQTVNPNPAGACNQGQFHCNDPMAQATNEPGSGYLDVVSATGGTSYSPCVADPGAALQAIVDAVTGAASQFQLTGQPISSTIKVGITRVGQTTTSEILRSKANGFDYDPVSNSIFFRGTARPAVNDRVTVSYRVWLPPEAPCGRPCGANQICDGQLGVCTCDQGQCNANCTANQVCDANCACTCTADCNGNCGPNQVCNQATCACECPADCGGCGPGTVCNPSTCACECDQNCGGACGQTPNLVCNTAACNCQCPSDCGGRCTAPNTTCNTSTCECSCGPACDAACGGAGRCDPANNCACACPADCGGCQDGSTCNQAACACECGAGTCTGCSGRQVCNATTHCGCECPADCGGCGPTEHCNAQLCVCESGI